MGLLSERFVFDYDVHYVFFFLGNEGVAYKPLEAATGSGEDFNSLRIAILGTDRLEHNSKLFWSGKFVSLIF